MWPALDQATKDKVDLTYQESFFVWTTNACGSVQLIPMSRMAFQPFDVRYPILTGASSLPCLCRCLCLSCPRSRCLCCEQVMKDGIADITWGGKPYTITKALIQVPYPLRSVRY